MIWHFFITKKRKEMPCNYRDALSLITWRQKRMFLATLVHLTDCYLSMFADWASQFIQDAFGCWATVFYWCLCCLNSFPCNAGNVLMLTKQYTKPQMTSNTHHQNMTFKAFLDFSIKWQHPGGLFRGRPATTLLWILQFECKEDVTLINVSIFVYLWGAAYISFLKYS